MLFKVFIQWRCEFLAGIKQKKVADRINRYMEKLA